MKLDKGNYFKMGTYKKKINMLKGGTFYNSLSMKTQLKLTH